MQQPKAFDEITADGIYEAIKNGVAEAFWRFDAELVNDHIQAGVHAAFDLRGDLMLNAIQQGVQNAIEQAASDGLFEAMRKLRG